MTTDVDLTERERAIVNAFQGGFPVVERPFEPAAAAMRERGVDIDAAELLETIQDLDERGVLSRFGALVNAQEIGGAATLVAMHAPRTGSTRSSSGLTTTARWLTTTSASIHLNVWFVVSVADETAWRTFYPKSKRRRARRRTTSPNNRSSASRPSSTSTDRSTATGTTRRPGSIARSKDPT